MYLFNVMLMEFQIFCFSILFTFIVAFYFMLVKRLKKSKINGLQKLPPGPHKLPVTGNLHQLVGSQPHRRLTSLAKKYGPIMHLQLGEVSAVVISSPDAAKEVMKTHDLIFATRPVILASKILSYDCTNIVFAPYGSYWRQLKKICILELLSAKRVQEFRSIREEEVWNLIESISMSRAQLINISRKMFKLTTDITARAAFGKRCKDQDELIYELSEAGKLAGGFNVPDIFPSLKFLHVISGVKPAVERIHRRLDKILNDIISQHKVKRETTVSMRSEEDLVDVLLNLQEQGDPEFPLTTDNIKAVILDIFSAGSDTSSTTLEWAMSELIKNPKAMENAQAEVRSFLQGKKKIEENDIQELHYLKSVIKETLRLHPAAPLLIPRESREKCEINGYEIPFKAKVIVNAWAIGRDSDYWTDADCFKPERFLHSSIDFRGNNFEYIPFGAGRRMCPGISFGIATIELSLAQLLYHFDWKLPSDLKPDQLDMSEVFGVTVRRENELHLIATPYVSLL